MYDELKKILINHGIDLLINDDTEFDDLITDMDTKIKKEFE